MTVTVKQLNDNSWGVQTPIGIVVVATEDEAEKLARQIRIKWQEPDNNQ